jgi:hypothetical protein
MRAFVVPCELPVNEIRIQADITPGFTHAKAMRNAVGSYSVTIQIVSEPSSFGVAKTQPASATPESEWIIRYCHPGTQSASRTGHSNGKTLSGGAALLCVHP